MINNYQEELKLVRLIGIKTTIGLTITLLFSFINEITRWFTGQLRCSFNFNYCITIVIVIYISMIISLHIQFGILFSKEKNRLKLLYQI